MSHSLFLLKLTYNSTYKEALAEIIFVGNGDIDATKTYHIDDLAFNALVYSEAAVGYSYNLNDNLNLGAKLKFSWDIVAYIPILMI
jgi:hypothetical protein